MSAADEIRQGLLEYAARAGDWASESTATEILKELQHIAKRTTKADQSAKKQDPEEKKATEEKQKNNKVEKEINKDRQKALNDLSRSISFHNEKLGHARDSLKRFGNTTRALGDVIKTFPGIFGIVGSAVSGFGKFLMTPAGAGLAVFALAVKEVTDYLFDSIAVFNNLREVGVTFVGGLSELRIAAANAAVPFDEFARLMVDNSTVISAFGRDGALTFGTLSKEARNLAIMQRGMAFTTDQVNEHLMEYLEQQRLAGTLETLSAMETARRNAEYMQSLDMFSQALGRSRKELAESSKKMLEPIRVQAALRALPAEIRTTVMDNLKRAGPAFDALGPEFLNMMQDLIATNGRPVSEFAQKFIAISGPLGDEVMNLASRMRRGQVSNDEFVRSIARMKNNVGPVADDLSKLVAQLGDTDPTLAAVVESLLQVERSNNDLTKSVPPTIRFMNMLSETIKSLQSMFDTVLADIFKNLEGPLNQLANWISERVLPAMREFSLQIGNIFRQDGEFIDKMVASFELVFSKVADVLTPILTSIFEHMMDNILGFFGIESSRVKARRKKEEETKRERQSNMLETDRLEVMRQKGLITEEAFNRRMQSLHNAGYAGQFATGGMGNFGSGTPVMLHGEEAVIPTVGRKVPVDVKVKLDPVQLQPTMQSTSPNVDLAKDSTIQELIKSTKELIEISKSQVGATTGQTRALNKSFREGFGNLEGSFAS